jgi:hypothetical protein
MATPEETNDLLREIRDLLANQQSKYEGYLADMERHTERQRERYDEQYGRQLADYKRAAWQRTIAWMFWAAGLVGVLILFSR